MSTVNPVVTAGQSFFAMILKDIITTGGSPLLTFLAAFGAAAGDPVKIQLALGALAASEAGQLTPFEALLSQQIATGLATKLQGLMASHVPPATAPVA